MTRVNAIILAGGLGTRLQSIVPDVPKVLAPVNGRPFLDILLESIERADCVNRVVLALGHKSRLVIDHVRSGRSWNFQVEYSIETELLGTAGATRLAFRQTDSDPILVFNGDSYIEIDLPALFCEQAGRGRAATIAVRPSGDAERYGSVRMDGHGRILGFEEKRASNGAGHINAGVYACSRQLLQEIPEDVPLSIERDVFPRLASAGELYAHVCHGRFIDIGVPDSYSEAQRFFSTR